MGRPFRFGAGGWFVFFFLGILVILILYRSGVVDFPDGDNVLVNGDIEDGTLSPNCVERVQNACQPPGPNEQPIPDLEAIPPAVLTSVPGWTVVAARGQDVAWLGPNNPFLHDIASHGHKFIDLSGYTDQSVSGSSGGVRQTFATKAGRRYMLFFDIGVFIDSSTPTFSGPITVVASIDSQPLSPPCAFNPTTPGKQWRTCQYPFPAAAATT